MMAVTTGRWCSAWRGIPARHPGIEPVGFVRIPPQDVPKPARRGLPAASIEALIHDVRERGRAAIEDLSRQHRIAGLTTKELDLVCRRLATDCAASSAAGWRNGVHGQVIEHLRQRHSILTCRGLHQ
jgi:hypothetical protein